MIISVLLSNLLSIINYLLMLHFIFGCNITIYKKKYALLFLLLSILMNSILVNKNYYSLTLIINLFFCIALLNVLLDFKFLKKLSIIVIVIFIETIICAISQCILNTFFIFNSNIIKVFSSLIICISSYIIGKYLKKSNFLFIREQNLYLYFFLILTLLLGISLATITILFNNYYQFYIFIVIICIVLIILNTIGIFMYIFKKEENITFQNTIASNQALIAIQTKYIEQLKDTYQALRILKHDMHSYFHNIEYLLKMKNYTELENLITELKIVTSSSILSTCSNTYIAATIYPFLSTMEQNQIVFHFNYQVFQDINMKNIELCALFYNLLKNAVEANQNNKEYKEITLEISRKHSSMLINLTNTISSTFSLKQIKNKQTLKDNKLEHGLGLISIEKIVNTYHGDISYDVKNNTLHTSIVLLNIFDI